MRWWEQLFAKQRPPGGILPEGYHPPPRVLSGWDLTAMGIGATIGAGIFVTAGQVALTAGPGVILSFVIAGCGCALAGLCYAEFAALAPTGGSAYSYAYSTMGELLAWIVGWDLVLEYAFAGSIVAVEWSLNLVALLEALGVQVPRWLVDLEIPIAANYVVHVNFITMLIISIVTYILILGVKESARANAVMVVVKVGVVLLVICAGVWFVVPANWLNAPGAPAGLMPNGFAAVMTGAAVVFFSYIGFDAVSTHAEETVAPGRNLPLGILGSLVICTVLYIGVAVVLIGMVPWPQMPREAPVVNAFIQLGGWVARVAGIVIGIGAIAGMTSVILITFSGQARIFRAMARDGLLPRRIFAVQHPRYHTPHRSLILTGAVACAIASLVPRQELFHMISIGTLMAFAIVCAAVLVLRKAHPEFRRPFRCPALELIAPLGIAVNIYMMSSLPPDAWLRLGVWMVIGLVLYFTYGRIHSEVARHRAPPPQAGPEPLW